MSSFIIKWISIHKRNTFLTLSRINYFHITLTIIIILNIFAKKWFDRSPNTHNNVYFPLCMNSNIQIKDKYLVITDYLENTSI